jgi:hypothetical protein
VGQYRIVQPWGSDKGRQATTISEHATVADAFAAIDALAARMERTGVRGDYLELIVVDEQGNRRQRPGAN